MTHSKTKVLLSALVAAGALASLPAHAGKTLDSIKAKGQVVCGVNTGLAGFSQAISPPAEREYSLISTFELNTGYSGTRIR